MAGTPLYVVDAWAVLKWTFQSEPGSQEAVDLVADYVGGRVHLVGPYQLAYEVASVIRRRVLEGYLATSLGRRFLTEFLALRIPADHPDGFITTAYDYSFRYSISLYDSLYAALARIRQCSLITGDERLL